MFVGDEVRAQARPAVARTRLAALLAGSGLMAASSQAFGDGLARIGPLGPVPGLSKLVQIRASDPVQRGAATFMSVRWEAAGAGERLFPVLDADITMVPDGEDATLIGLQGVYRPPGGPAGALLDRAILHRVAAATIRSFLSCLAAAIQEPAVDGAEAARDAAPRSPATPELT